MQDKFIFQAKSLVILLVVVMISVRPVHAHPDGPESQLVMTSYGGFCDYFSENALYKGWIWTDPLNDSSYSLNANVGNLRISTPDGEHDLFLNHNAPRMLQAFTGDFIIRTKVTINPQFDYQGAGLVIWQDANNYIRLEIGGTDRVINYIHRINGDYFDLNPDPASGLSTAYLQISRTGNMFSASYSVNGTTWFPVYTANYAASNVLYAGIALINNWQDNPIYADFDFFEVGGCSASKTITQRVLHVIYNPYLPTRQTYLLSYYNDPRAISQEAMTSFRDYTQGTVNYVIKEELEVNAFPLRSDGFRHTEETFFYCVDNGWPNISMCDENIRVNYDDVIAVNGICGRLNSGAIDEVWLDPPPRTGFFESALAGPRGFWYNGLTYSNNNCQELIPLMTFNYSRNWDGGHAFGHRMEATMTFVYGSWTGNTPNPHNWEKFGMVRFQSPNFNYAGCGSIHFTPNAQSSSNEYQYNLTGYFDTICDDFYNYPNLGNPQTVKIPTNCTAWGCTDYGYYSWWFSHIPRQSGKGLDGKLNNWWIYFLDPNQALYRERTYLPLIVK